MKFVVISRLAPGVENTRKALEVFLKAGLSPGAEATYAAGDGKTFINIIESDTPDMERYAKTGSRVQAFWACASGRCRWHGQQPQRVLCITRTFA